MSFLNVNGVLTRIDVPSASVSGDVVFTNGSALEVDATIGQPTREQRFTLGAAISDATAVIYVMQADLPAGQAIEEGYRVVANLEDEAAVTYGVIKRALVKFGDLSHYELFCKVA